MKDHNGCRRGFTWTSKAWYASYFKIQNELVFGMYYQDGRPSGEVYVEWLDINGRLVPRLHVFNKSLKVLASFTDVIQKLGEHDDENITPERFVEILLSCGFVDDTPYERNKEGRRY